VSPRAATLVSFSSTVALYVIFWLAGEFGSPALSAVWNESLLKLALWAVPSIVIVGFMWRMPPVEALRELGLATNPLPGVALGLLTLIPLVVLLTQGRLSPVSAGAVVGTSLVGPFAEEVLFRGLLFRQFLRRGGRSVIWSMAVSALVFGSAHLTLFVGFSHGHFSYTPWLDPYINEFAVTMLGGLLLAWIVYRCDSLWPAVGVHSALNFSWQLTQNSSDVTSFAATMMRLASITIAIYVTWRVTRRKRDQLRTWKPELGTSEDHV
jgi:membrane protease YdiL (CAAX protease family)